MCGDGFFSNRRRFLKRAAGLAALAISQGIASGADEPNVTWAAAIIGHTGHGDYGHELDVCFNGVPGVTIVAVADLDPVGRARAAAQCGAAKTYADYRQMLDRERPRLVVIAPRWSEEHHDMALAALDAGAHVLVEKPITVSLAE